MTQLSVSQVREMIPVGDSTKRWREKREDLHIRNQDPHNSHDIDVVIRNGDSVVHRGDYRLLPDQAGCSVDLLSTGQYYVFVTVDETTHATADVRVSDARRQTIYIEITAGSVSIHQEVRE